MRSFFQCYFSSRYYFLDYPLGWIDGSLSSLLLREEELHLSLVLKVVPL